MKDGEDYVSVMKENLTRKQRLAGIFNLNMRLKTVQRAISGIVK